MPEQKDLISDLDALLSRQATEATRLDEDVGSEDELSSGNTVIVQPLRWPEIKVEGTSVTIVAVLLDDSGSISGDGKDEKLTEGAEDMIEQLKSVAREGKEIFLNITGFRRTYFSGNVLHADSDEILRGVRFVHDSTPLVRTSLEIARTADCVETVLNNQGISVRVSMLLITDGLPNSDITPFKFKEQCIKKYPHWKFSGMGITCEDEREASYYREEFTKTFEKMGIDNIVTPSTNGVKEALYQYSKSVSML